VSLLLEIIHFLKFKKVQINDGQEITASNLNTTQSSNQTTTLDITTTATTITVSTNSSASTASTTPETKTSKCLNDGSVDSNNQCKCINGYFGDKCELAKCVKDSKFLNQCLNEGLCVQNTQTKLFYCQCIPSYTGSLCEIPICLDYCKNNAICNDGLGDQYEFNSTNITSRANVSCECTSPRYSGDRCQFDLCFDKNPKKDCVIDYVDSECKEVCDTECDKLFCKLNGECKFDPENDTQPSCL
jgi:hypothetical protein